LKTNLHLLTSITVSICILLLTLTVRDKHQLQAGIDRQTDGCEQTMQPTSRPSSRNVLYVFSIVLTISSNISRNLACTVSRCFVCYRHS